MVTYFILPRIRENIRLRKNKIANDIERAESIKLELENMISLSNIKLEEAKHQAQVIINETLIRSNKIEIEELINLSKNYLLKVNKRFLYLPSLFKSLIINIYDLGLVIKLSFKKD